MELITWTLIVIFGLFPPFIVGVWSYRQGRKGYNEAIESRDMAITILRDLQDDLGKLFNRVNNLPNEKVLLDKIQKSIQGSWGSVIRKGKKVVNGELDELAGDMAGQIPAERKQQIIADKIQNALLTKVLDKIG